ncbi:interferon-induced transmembrane protein 3-like [Leptonychotes weddellii]|uniref:Interferon-induced transmembrane protein 3-like n=1 Tax=Leptonychotes weddellii TaxID=9713 RepID=A0A7F8QPW2_LEPWE|nr:interferon-induced transmembrane protein 3-like [Leptonychotes weddellii]
MLKEEYEMAVLGAHQSWAPLTTTMINIHSEMSMPNYIIWSLFNTIFTNLGRLGFVALAYSMNSRDWKMVDDMIGAQAYASTTKCLNIWALVMNVLINLIVILIL